MLTVRRILALSIAVCILLTIAVSGVAAQDFTGIDWGEPDFEKSDKTSNVTSLDNGTIKYDATDEVLQFRFQNSSGGFSNLGNESIQIYIDTDQDETTGLSNGTYSDPYYNNISSIGADYNVQIGNGEQTLFEWVDTSGSGYFSGITGVTANRSDSEVIVEVPIDQIEVEEGDVLRLKFAYVEDDDLNSGTYDWAPDGEPISFTTSDADGESGTITAHAISGTVDVEQDDGGLNFTPTDVTVTAITDGGNEADEDTVTINDKGDNKTYSLTVDAEKFEGDGGEIQAEFNVTRDDFRLNESQTPRTVGDLDQGTSTEDFIIEPAATVNGTVVVAGEPGLGPDSTANVEFTVAGQADDVTLASDDITLDSDTAEKDYNVTAFADEFNTLTATITNQNATDTDLALNKTEISSLDLAVGDQQRENFEVQPPQIGVSVVPVENEPIDVNKNDIVKVGIELDNNLGVDVYSINHTLEYDEAVLNVTNESDVDFSNSTFANSSEIQYKNTKAPSDDNVIQADIVANTSQTGDVILYNATFEIVDSFQNEEGIDFNADGNEVATGDIVQTRVKAVDENNETIDNFRADTRSIGFTQTKTFVEINQTETLLKTKTNMVGSDLKVEATAESPNNGDLKNISLINAETGTELDNISCDGATCSTNNSDKSLLVYQPTRSEITLGDRNNASGYNTTDKFEVKAYGNGDGTYENESFNLDRTPIYERGDISTATGTEPGNVSIIGLTKVSNQRGAETDELPWDEDRIIDNSVYDVNNDGQIDIVDLTIVAREGA
jgi:hypothetical protein